MIYFVTFEKHVNCRIDDMIFHCEAKNAKEAVQIAKEYWQKYDFKPHQFHLYAKKSRIQDPDLLQVHLWNGETRKGAALMNNFYCVDFRTWRVNGINKYGPRAGQHYRL